MRSLAVLEKLGVSVEAMMAIFLAAFVQLSLRMASVVFTSVSTGRERSVTEHAFEWSLSSVHPFMHLEVGFV